MSKSQFNTQQLGNTQLRFRTISNKTELDMLRIKWKWYHMHSLYPRPFQNEYEMTYCGSSEGPMSK
jgi:hypothetical protein